MLAIVFNAHPGPTREQALGGYNTFGIDGGCGFRDRYAADYTGCFCIRGIRHVTGHSAWGVIHGCLLPGSEMNAIFFRPAWRAWAMAVITNS